MNTTSPTTLVVLGATGDLMAKKIIPALFDLHARELLPDNFRIVGVSRRNWTDEDLHRHVEAIIQVKVKDAPSALVESFLQRIVYHKIQFDMFGDYVALKDALEKIDQEHGVRSNKIFYLSVPPEFYSMIFEHMHRSGLVESFEKEGEWVRVAVEKPFGSDEESAKALDDQIAALFREDQVYRIDHYLAKEMLQNIMAFRFANNLFEDEWNTTFIERINLRLFESIGVEDRGAFYDNVGALRDVGQNHLLQMLALITMERPVKFDAEGIRTARAALLGTLKIPTIEEAAKDSFRAQYEGYQNAKGVSPTSKIETYFWLKGFLSGPRWNGVPFVMEAGKRMGDPKKEIEILLRHEEPCACPPGEHCRNRIVIRLEPHEGITVTFYAKKPGFTRELEERSFNYRFRDEGQPHAQYTEEYKKLLLDCISGDQTLFVSSEEIAAMWRFTDPFTEAWKKNLTPLRRYAPDTEAISAEANVKDVESSRPMEMPEGMKKEIGIFGLGKMGANVARQLHEKGWRVVAANRSPDPVTHIQSEGIEGVFSLEELARSLEGPRIIWLMITAGQGNDELLFGKKLRGGKTEGGLVQYLKKGDIVIDAANAFYEDTRRRAKLLEKKGIHFMDVGFSGGPNGARHGGSLMIGGDRKLFKKLEPLFRDLSVPGGYSHFGDAGSGHFVKMVHNGIEYGMMQSIAEGFALMKKSPFKLNLEQIANVYNHGSVIESKLVAWLEEAYKVYGQDLKAVAGSVAYTGEGEWTVKTGKKLKIPTPVIEDSFKFRVNSKKSPSYTGKILSALRNRFGGHAIDQGKKK